MIFAKNLYILLYNAGTASYLHNKHLKNCLPASFNDIDIPQGIAYCPLFNILLPLLFTEQLILSSTLSYISWQVAFLVLSSWLFFPAPWWQNLGWKACYLPFQFLLQVDFFFLSLSISLSISIILPGDETSAPGITALAAFFGILLFHPVPGRPKQSSFW